MATVLFVTNMYPTASVPYYGIFVKQQAEALRARAFDVEIVFINGRANKLAYVSAVVQLTRRLREGGIDAIHCHHTFAALAVLAARRLSGRKIPVLFSFHEGEVFAPKLSLKPREWQSLKKFVLRRVDFVMPVERRMIAAALGPEAARVRSEVIPAGIEVDKFTPGDSSAARKTLNWPSDGSILFFPFTIGKPAKRHDLAAAAFEIIRAKNPRTHLIVGGGLRHDQMADALRGCDVLLLISDYEASPTVVKEALACERPVVATDVGDVRENYGDLPGVIIVEPNPEAIARGIEEALAAPQPFGARERIEKLGLTIEKTADKLIECYRKIRII